MATCTIDGKGITVDSGTTILQAAQRLGISIPHYCYHPNLSIAGNCRICYVEVEGIPKLLTSCSTVVTDGMVVHTQSEMVQRGRKDVMELLLLNHPLDCPECDQAGECKLQDYSFKHGNGASRLKEPKRVNPPKDLGPSIVLYTNRCIMCTRCVRFCKEISGYEELGVFNRGAHNQIDIFPGKPIAHKMAGNVVDICPVGALVDKDFLHKARVWHLLSTPSICPGCSKGCNIDVDVHHNEIQRLKPRLNPDVNECWICDDGRYGYHQWNDVEYLIQPLQKREENQQPVSWDEAVHTAAEQLRNLAEEHGPDSVAVIGSAMATNEENYLLKVLGRDILNTSHVALYQNEPDGYSETFRSGFTIEPDKNPNTAGARKMLGLQEGDNGLESILAKIQSGAIHGVYMLANDFRNGFSDAELQLLDSLRCLVVQDAVESPAAQRATIVLPCASPWASDGTYLNSTGRMQRLQPGLELQGIALPGWEIFERLFRACRAEVSFESPEDVFQALAADHPDMEGLTYDRIGDQGVPLFSQDAQKVQV